MFMEKQPACSLSCSMAKIYTLWLRWFNSSSLQKATVPFLPSPSTLAWNHMSLPSSFGPMSARIFTELFSSLIWWEYCSVLPGCSSVISGSWSRSVQERERQCASVIREEAKAMKPAHLPLEWKVNLAQAVIPNIVLSPCSHGTSLISLRLTYPFLMGLLMGITENESSKEYFQFSVRTEK